MSRVGALLPDESRCVIHVDDPVKWRYHGKCPCISAERNGEDIKAMLLHSVKGYGRSLTVEISLGVKSASLDGAARLEGFIPSGSHHTRHLQSTVVTSRGDEKDNHIWDTRWKIFKSGLDIFCTNRALMNETFISDFVVQRAVIKLHVRDTWLLDLSSGHAVSG